MSQDDDYTPGAAEDAAIELFDQLEARIERIEEVFDLISLEERLARFEERLDRIEARLNRIEHPGRRLP